MVAQNFTPALRCVLVHEGGLDDDPRDPGGRTAYGIIQRRYNQYRRAKGLPIADVWKITPAEREEIYRIYYWDVCRASDLPAGLDYAVFDACVNSGDVQAGKWLQRAVNDERMRFGQGPIAVDGRIGDGTLQAVDELGDTDAVIAALSRRRLAMLRNLKTFQYYGRGWTRRVNEVEKLAQAVARGSVPGPTPAGWVTAPVTKVAGKAFVSDAKPLPGPTGGVVTSALGIVSSTSSQIEPMVDPVRGMSPWVDTILQVVAVAGVVAGIVGVAWVAYANQRARRMASELDIEAPPAAEPETAPEVMAAWAEAAVR